jgi:hypothetical protein
MNKGPSRRVRQGKLSGISIAVILALLLPALADASNGWSGCQTITGVSYEPTNQTLILTLSPGIPGCSPFGITGAAQFVVGALGVTTDNLNGLLASSLSAYSVGRPVLIGYDNSSSGCYSTSISLGGYLPGQC